MSKQRPLRVGAVSYLNTKPLVYDLKKFAPQIEVVYDLPSRLADDLNAGRLDVALIPSVEYFRHPELRIVSNACIGCRGPVLSVVLLGRKPLNQIRSLALDEGSRTSVALARILLRERYGIQPTFCPFPIGSSVDDVAADAVLVIGDRAMHLDTSKYTEVWDLGQEWCRWSDLPFVFAMWVARPHCEVGDLPVALELARDAGVEHLAQIASTEAEGVGLSAEECHCYLRDNLHFFLGPTEQAGLDLFRHHATSSTVESLL